MAFVNIVTLCIIDASCTLPHFYHVLFSYEFMEGLCLPKVKLYLYESFEIGLDRGRWFIKLSPGGITMF